MEVSIIAGNFYTDSLPPGHDLALVSAIIHMNSTEQNVDLYKKIFDALVPGGRIVIRDHVMKPDKTAPKSGALFAINMLTATTGGGTFTFEEYREDLAAAGFGGVAAAFMANLIPTPNDAMLFEITNESIALAGGTRELLAAEQHVLDAGDRLVRALASQAGSPTARVLDVAGRQAMLAQRLVKTYAYLAWGFDQPSISNGAVYVDLDQDGDEERDERGGAMWSVRSSQGWRRSCGGRHSVEVLVDLISAARDVSRCTASGFFS